MGSDIEDKVFFVKCCHIYAFFCNFNTYLVVFSIYLAIILIQEIIKKKNTRILLILIIVDKG